MATKSTKSTKATKPFSALYAAFNKEIVRCSDGTERPMGAVSVSRATLYEVSYAIAAWTSLLSTKLHLARDKALHSALTGIKVTTRVGKGKETEERVVSLNDMALKVLSLYDTYCDKVFLDSTMCRNHRPGKGVLPFGTEDDARTVLGRAGLLVLARAFCFYLEQTVKRMFPRDAEEWDSASATYSVGYGKDRVSRSSADFAMFAGDLLDLYDQICLLTEDCSEYADHETAAYEAGESEKASRQTQRPRRNQPRVAPQNQGQRRILIRTTAPAVAPVAPVRPPTNRFGALEVDDDAEDVVEATSTA